MEGSSRSKVGLLLEQSAYWFLPIRDRQQGTSRNWSSEVGSLLESWLLRVGKQGYIDPHRAAGKLSWLLRPSSFPTDRATYRPRHRTRTHRLGHGPRNPLKWAGSDYRGCS